MFGNRIEICLGSPGFPGFDIGDEFVWNVLETPSEGFFERVVERVVHSLVDAIGDIEIELMHGVDRELPGVVLFEAAWFVGAKPDGMVTDFVEKNGGGHRSLGLW